MNIKEYYYWKKNTIDWLANTGNSINKPIVDFCPNGNNRLDEWCSSFTIAVNNELPTAKYSAWEWVTTEEEKPLYSFKLTGRYDAMKNAKASVQLAAEVRLRKLILNGL